MNNYEVKSKMKYYLRLLGIVATGCALLPTYADNLMQVYAQAVKSDPIFSQAQSNWQAQKMNLPIAEAGYLPQFTVTANGGPGFTNSGSAFFGGEGTTNSQYGYNLSLSQTIFNVAAWAQIKSAGASVKAATATYLAAQQSLMQRTVQTYLNVLQAYDQLRYTVANKKAVKQQLVIATEQFRVGLIAITNEYEAKANYDQVVAQQIAAQNNLNTQLEALRQLTGRNYASLQKLGKKLPLICPQPNNIDQWVDVANTQNYSIKAQNYNVQAAMEKIKQQAASNYPSIALTGAYAGGNSTQNLNSTSTAGLSTSGSYTSGNIGLSLNYQPIQGGLILASTQQARYNYATAAGLLEQTHRNVVYQARSSFLSVLSNVSQLKADRQTIVSARNALAATEAGLKVGTHTMVDVLTVMTALYHAQEQYAIDQYTYINNLIGLKAAAGTLSVADLQQINTWLKKTIYFPEQTSITAIPTDRADQKIQLEDVVQPTKVVQKKQAAVVAQSVLIPFAIATPAHHSVAQKPVIVPAMPQLLPPQTTQLPMPAST